ncbi:hypothetical protein TNCV_3190871 [Trichonephila clavipes]|nr:hypothetical protein TNCV_3190871 [Trichonephila clavipes]
MMSCQDIEIVQLLNDEITAQFQKQRDALRLDAKKVLKIEVDDKEKIGYILQFFFDKGENASQVAEILIGVYGADTVKAYYVQFWFRRFLSGIFDVKVAPRPSSKMSIKSQK